MLGLGGGTWLSRALGTKLGPTTVALGSGLSDSGESAIRRTKVWACLSDSGESDKRVCQNVHGWLIHQNRTNERRAYAAATTGCREKSGCTMAVQPQDGGTQPKPCGNLQSSIANMFHTFEGKIANRTV